MMVRDILRGVNALRRGFQLLRSDRSLRRIALIPLLLNVILFAVGIPVAIWLVAGWAGELLPGSGIVFGPLRILVQILVGLVVMVGALFLFTTVGAAVGAPFNALLAEAIERRFYEQRGEAINPAAIRDSPVGAIAGVITSFARLGIFLVLYPPILAVQLIPVVGPVLYPVCSLLYGAFVLSFDFSDPVLERHGVAIRARLSYLGRHKALYLGFGGTAMLMMLVPILNLMMIPGCVAGGTILYLEETLRDDDRRGPDFPRHVIARP